MAFKTIPELDPAGISNDSDTLMTRQGAEDLAVTVGKVRNIGTEVGQSMQVGEYGLGSSAKLITDYFAGDDANLITRTGVYKTTGSTTNIPEQGTIFHEDNIEGSAAGQTLIADASNKMYYRKRSGTWGTWERVLNNSDDRAAITSEIQDLYPVGTIYLTIDGTNPATSLGFGTWVAFSQGKVLLGVGTHNDGYESKTFASAELTGGKYQHKLTKPEMPVHKHTATSTDSGHTHPYSVDHDKDAGGYSNNARDAKRHDETTGTGYANITTSIDNEGGDGYHNNIQPYTTVYMWKRTA